MLNAISQIREFSLSMNEIVTGIFIWLLKMLGIYLALLIALTLILRQWKKKSLSETEEIEADQKKRSERYKRR